MEDRNEQTRYEISLLPLYDSRLRELPALSLAYIGDTVYDLYVRRYLVAHNLGTVEDLHHLASSVVNARSQAEAAKLLAPELTPDEEDVLRRGKNAKSAPTKNMTREDYSLATGLEALVGYLFLKGEEERLNCLFREIIEHFFADK